MSFALFVPTKNKLPIDAKTTNDQTDQMWKEFIALRYGRRKYFSTNTVSSCIDQASIYFLDALKSNWRSSGLLYYYSFLNLARAFLVAKKKISSKSMNTTRIFHGLTPPMQVFTNIMDFEITILPPKTNNDTNVFSSFYQVVTKQPWPFSNNISLKLRDIVGYCFDISNECRDLFQIQQDVFEVFSILENQNASVFLEFLVPDSMTNVFLSQTSRLNLEKTNFNDLPVLEQLDWGLIDPQIVFYSSVMAILKTNDLEDSPKNRSLLMNQATKYLRNNYVPVVYCNEISAKWTFTPNLTINGISIPWHPIFSDYIIAFALSNILRYQPQMLQNGTPNSFLMEAWCTQSSITSLKYFLMLFTDPPIRLQKY